MSSNKGNRTKRTSSYEYIYIAYEVQPFNINEYIQNPAMIKKLYEEMKIARVASSDLQIKLNDAKLDKQRLELQKQEVELMLSHSKKDLERLQEEKQNLSTELQSMRSLLEQLRNYNHQLEIQKRELDVELKGIRQKFDEIERASLFKYLVSLTAAGVLGFGVNIVTAAPYDWKGWTIITISIILAVIAFFIARKGD